MITRFSECLDYVFSIKNAALRIVRLKAALTDE